MKISSKILGMLVMVFLCISSTVFAAQYQTTGELPSGPHTKEFQKRGGRAILSKSLINMQQLLGQIGRNAKASQLMLLIGITAPRELAGQRL